MAIDELMEIAERDGVPTITDGDEVVGFVAPPLEEQSPEFRVALLEGEVDFWRRIVKAFVDGDAKIELSDTDEVSAVSFPSLDGSCRDRLIWG